MPPPGPRPLAPESRSGLFQKHAAVADHRRVIDRPAPTKSRRTCGARTHFLRRRSCQLSPPPPPLRPSLLALAGGIDGERGAPHAGRNANGPAGARVVVGPDHTYLSLVSRFPADHRLVGWPARPPTPIPSGRKPLVLSVFSLLTSLHAVPSPHRSLAPPPSGAVLTRRQPSNEARELPCRRPVLALPFHLLVPSRTSFAWPLYLPLPPS